MTKPPKKWKMAILVWIAIYPTITILFALFEDYFAMIPLLPLRTLASTVIIVPLMVFSIMPVLHRVFDNWLKH